MPSALIPPVGRKPAVPLAGQLAHESYVRPGPLVLGTAFLRSPTAASDRDRTVSRRSKPSSRTALMGEQPNPWDRLQPQDATSRHRTFSAVSSSADYIFTLLDESEGSACCGSHKFALCTSCHRGVSHSRYGVNFSRETTSHGIAHHRIQRWLGVHRYKPKLRRHF